MTCWLSKTKLTLLMALNHYVELVIDGRFQQKYEMVFEQMVDQDQD